jgi:hypothetical protein
LASPKATTLHLLVLQNMYLSKLCALLTHIRSCSNTSLSHYSATLWPVPTCITLRSRRPSVVLCAPYAHHTSPLLREHKNNMYSTHHMTHKIAVSLAQMQATIVTIGRKMTTRHVAERMACYQLPETDFGQTPQLRMQDDSAPRKKAARCAKYVHKSNSLASGD